MDKNHIIQGNIIRIKKTIIPIAIISFVSNLLQLAVPMYSLQVMDKVIGSHSLETLAVLTMVMLIAIFFNSLLESVKTKVINHIDYIFSGPLLSMLTKETVRQNIIYQNEDVISDNIEYFKKLHNFIAHYLTSLIDGPFALIYIFFLYCLHPAIGTLTLIGAILIFTFTELGKYLSKSSQKTAYNYSYLANNQIEYIKKIGGAIFANGIIGNIINRFAFLKKQEGESKLEQKSIQSIYNELTNSLRTILQIATTGICGYLILNNQLTTGAIIASSILSSKALAVFNKFSTAVVYLQESRSAYQYLSKNIESTIASKKPLEISQIKGFIKAERLIFCYPNSKKPVLKGLNIDVNPATINLIIGQEMSGKTTLLKMLATIYKPISGMVKYDQIDSSMISKDSIGNLIGYLPQITESRLAGETIKEAIARLDDKAKIDDIIKIAEKINLHNLVNSLEDGYNTKIIDGGKNLTSTIIRRIMLASALYRDPQILIFDDFDYEEDYQIATLNQLLQELRKQGKTIIIALRKMQNFISPDKILIIENGIIKNK